MKRIHQLSDKKHFLFSIIILSFLKKCAIITERLLLFNTVIVMSGSENFFAKILDSIREWLTAALRNLSHTEIGMNSAVRIAMVTISILAIWFLFKRMLKSQIKESAFLLWTLPAFLLFVYGMWPELTYYVADKTHLAFGYALVVTVPFIALLYYLAFKQMCQISAIMSKVVELGSVVSLQKHEIEVLKKRIAELESDGAAEQPAQRRLADQNVEVTIK